MPPEDQPQVNIETEIQILMDPNKYGRIYDDLSPGQRFVIQKWFNDQVKRVSALVAQSLGSEISGIELMEPCDRPN